jgi:hypothetical protein
MIDPDEVKVVLSNKVLDERYTRIAMAEVLFARDNRRRLEDNKSGKKSQ